MDDTNAFWDANLFTLGVLFPLKQVLLKDMDEPMKSVRPWAATVVGKFNVDKIDWKIVELAPNEFSSEDDYIGLFDSSEPEPETFFSSDKVSPYPVDLPLTSVDGLKQPRAQFEIKLSTKMYEDERKVYTLMTLFGDIGGFQGVIFMIPAFLLSFYTPKMFEVSLLSEMPVKRPKKLRKRSQNRRNEPPLGERLVNGQGVLNSGDVISLIQEMKLVKGVKTGFWETLCHV